MSKFARPLGTPNCCQTATADHAKLPGARILHVVSGWPRVTALSEGLHALEAIMSRYISLLAVGFAGVAFAQAPAFEEVDANADGAISQEEASAVEGLDFATCDANQDGQLGREEYEACTGGGGEAAPPLE